MCCNSNPRFTSETGIAQISTPNPNRDGSGTLGTVFTGRFNGTIISSITIVATGPTSQGMVRLFIDNSGTPTLLSEISIPATTPTGLVRAFALTVRPGLSLPNGCSLMASTEVGDTFNITALGRSYEYCECGT